MKTKWKVDNVWGFSPIDRDYASKFLLENDLSISQKRLKENPKLINSCSIPKEEVIYELNSFGFRCDEFEGISNNEKIFIFLGCSLTFGSAVRVNDTWAFKAHQLIQQSFNEPIRFINLSWPGSGLDYSARVLNNFCSHFGLDKVEGVFCLCPNVRRFEIPLSINTSPNIFAHHFPHINTDDDSFELMKIAKTKGDLMQNDNFCLNECVKSVSLIKMLAEKLQCKKLRFGFMENEGDEQVVNELITATGITDQIMNCGKYDLNAGFGIDFLHPGPDWHSAFVDRNNHHFA